MRVDPLGQISFSSEYIRQHVSRKKLKFCTNVYARKGVGREENSTKLERDGRTRGRGRAISSWKYSGPRRVKTVLKLFYPLTYGLHNFISLLSLRSLSLSHSSCENVVAYYLQCIVPRWDNWLFYN